VRLSPYGDGVDGAKHVAEGPFAVRFAVLGWCHSHREGQPQLRNQIPDQAAQAQAIEAGGTSWQFKLASIKRARRTGLPPTGWTRIPVQTHCGRRGRRWGWSRWPPRVIVPPNGSSDRRRLIIGRGNKRSKSGLSFCMHRPLSSALKALPGY
jgi:hypothetical protein